MARQVMNVSRVTAVFGEVHCTNCFLNNCKDLKSTMIKYLIKHRLETVYMFSIPWGYN